MKKIMVYFITAPAWQIFSLFVLPMFLFAMWPASSGSMQGTFLILLFAIWTVLMWIYSIGVLLHDKYSQYLNIPLTKFKICMIYGFIHPVVFMSDVVPFDYLLPFQFASLYCNIYALYFISKLIVLIERKAEVAFKDYIGTFVAAWFSWIGVWSIQPRVSKLFLSNEA